MVSSQKFIATSRAPRVQIEYDVALYGVEKKVQLPFVMGVMSDLAGKSEAPQPAIADRKFLEIDVDSFDDQMKSMKPRAAFAVPNTLTGEGDLAVDITFESMNDFSPVAIAAKVGPLKTLLNARTQIAGLQTALHGKAGAESLIENVLQDDAVLMAIASGSVMELDHSPALQNFAAQAETARRAAARHQAPDGAETRPPTNDTPPNDPLADLLADAVPMASEMPDDLLADPGYDPLADLLGDAHPTVDDIEREIEKTGIGGLIAPQEDDALAALLGDSEPDELEALLSADDPLADLDALLGPSPETNIGATTEPEEDAMSLLDDLLDAAPEAIPEAVGKASGFGHLTAAQPSAAALNRPRFRMAIFGDFSGRAARGEIAVGDALAKRRAIALDVDTVEEVIEGFATTLVLPIGPDGKGIAVKLGGLDDLHPDELVDNLELFEALKSVRARLSNPSTAAAALREMQGWGESHTIPAAATQGRSAASSIPADKKLSDFQRLIGDSTGRLSQASPIDDLLGQIVGPHIVPGPNPEAEALKASVDEAMSSAMRLVLHHPEFQAIEAQWRMLDLLARRIETDAKLTITLYDVSAEEIAADLASAPDLAQSGLFRLLNDPVQDEGAVGFSAMFGMYSFEETPPHADLLARLAKIAAHVQAPFFTAMAPGFMEVPLADRHPLTAAAWDKLRQLPEAAYLGLATPRFMLRRPYGKKTEPIDAFAFEEFTQSEGLKGLLWANPVALVAVLLAQAWQDGGQKMVLGDVMSLDDIPFHFVTDQHGDQVALPCTERNLTEARTQLVIGRGYMPVVSIRGRDVVRLASFQSLAGAEIAGPWSGPRVVREAPETAPLDVAITHKAPQSAPEAAEDDLDALLAGFGDIAAPTDPDSIDAELAALLEGL